LYIRISPKKLGFLDHEKNPSLINPDLSLNMKYFWQSAPYIKVTPIIKRKRVENILSFGGS
jgi:hypothetical protein